VTRERKNPESVEFFLEIISSAFFVYLFFLVFIVFKKGLSFKTLATSVLMFALFLVAPLVNAFKLIHPIPAIIIFLVIIWFVSQRLNRYMRVIVLSGLTGLWLVYGMICLSKTTLP
jgi:hypothetical protein